MTQDRLAERRFVEGAGIAVAPWREVRSVAEARAAAEDLGLPLRLKLPIGGYDGRSQLRIVDVADLDDAWERLGQPPGAPLLAERELDFELELSVVVARSLDGVVATFPISRNRHDAGILVESVAPAPVAADVAARAAAIGCALAEAMDLCGTLTAELFLLRDGSLVVNELAPRVHNSGHWTIEGAATSQFEQHIRAICGLGLGSTAALAPTAMVNLLGTRRASRGPPARRRGALADPDVHLHLYDKREVFERRKMGHLTALGPDVDGRSRRPVAALAMLHWADDTTKEDGPMTEATAAPVVGIVGGSRSDFPTLEAAVAVLDELGVAVGAQGRVGAPDPGPALPLRRGGRRPRDQGHRRRRRRRRPSARDARRQDRPPGHRRPDPDPAPGRARFAPLDRPDAAGRAGRDGRHRQRHQCRPAGRGDPGPLRRGAGGAPRRWRASQTQAVLDDPSNG